MRLWVISAHCWPCGHTSGTCHPRMLFVLVETNPHRQTSHQKALRGLIGLHFSSQASGSMAMRTHLVSPPVQGMDGQGAEQPMRRRSPTHPVNTGASPAKVALPPAVPPIPPTPVAPLPCSPACLVHSHLPPSAFLLPHHHWILGHGLPSRLPAPLEAPPVHSIHSSQRARFKIDLTARTPHLQPLTASCFP